jgi:hypothetical protein
MQENIGKANLELWEILSRLELENMTITLGDAGWQAL